MTRSRARVMGRFTIMAAVGTLVACAVALASRPADPRAPGSALANAGRLAPPMPATGAYFGAWVQPGSYSEPAKIAAVEALQRRIGRRLDIVHSYLKWRAPFPTASQRAAMHDGSYLLLSWAGNDTRAIASGAYDGWIRQRARSIKATHKPIFLEWRWEMNRPNLRSQVHSPADYIAAWDHIRSIFSEEHVENTAWVWCPSSKGFGTSRGRHRSGAAFYPGDDEVDWICVDAYPRAGTYSSFASVLRPFLAWASHITKPIMIGEYGVPRGYGPRRRARWLRGATQVIRAYPQIKAVVYFDGDPAGNKRWSTYGLDAGSDPMHVFGDIAQEPYFNRSRRPVSW